MSARKSRLHQAAGTTREKGRSMTAIRRQAKRSGKTSVVSAPRTLNSETLALEEVRVRLAYCCSLLFLLGEAAQNRVESKEIGGAITYVSDGLRRQCHQLNCISMNLRIIQQRRRS
jgi:hypothetical protein